MAGGTGGKFEVPIGSDTSGWTYTGDAGGSLQFTDDAIRITHSAAGTSSAIYNTSNGEGTGGVGGGSTSRLLRSALRRRLSPWDEWPFLRVVSGLRARFLGPLDTCSFDVSADNGLTWTQPSVVTLADGADDPASPDYNGVTGQRTIASVLGSHVLLRILFTTTTGLSTEACDLLTASVEGVDTTTTTTLTATTTTAPVVPTTTTTSFGDGDNNIEVTEQPGYALGLAWWVYLIIAVAIAIVIIVVVVVAVQAKEKKDLEQKRSDMYIDAAKTRSELDLKRKEDLQKRHSHGTFDDDDDDDGADDEEVRGLDVDDLELALPATQKMVDRVAGVDSKADPGGGGPPARHNKKLSKSMRLLQRSLATPEGQMTLNSIANMYYDGDTEKARQYLMFKLQKEVATGDGEDTASDEDNADLDFDDSQDVRRSVSWKVRRSMKLLERNLATPAGQQSLRDVADMYYDGDLKKAKAYLMIKLQNEVKSQHQTDGLGLDDPDVDDDYDDMFNVVAGGADATGDGGSEEDSDDEVIAPPPKKWAQSRANNATASSSSGGGGGLSDDSDDDQVISPRKQQSRRNTKRLLSDIAAEASGGR